MPQTSCPKCVGKHKDYRSEAGHLAMDPVTGATISSRTVTNSSNLGLKKLVEIVGGEL